MQTQNPVDSRDIIVVLYRTGGWANAQWHSTTAIDISTEDGRQAFAERCKDVNRKGYAFKVMKAEHLVTHGPPVGFCRHADAITGEMAHKWCDCD